MSTLASANLSSDDSDKDFVPTEAKRTRKTKKPVHVLTSSCSSSSSCASNSASDEEDGDDRELKKARITGPGESEAEERRQRAREEFERMKAEVAEGPSEVDKKEEEMVEIKRPRRFAGETIHETVKVKTTDPEAMAYFNKSNGSCLVENKDSKEKPSSIAKVFKLPLTEPISGPFEGTPPIATTSRPKGPPIRKKRQTLEQMSAALDKGKKMTTLEKSQMDWKNHASSSEIMANELAANRRSGGYLEKKDFLDRVEERRSDAYEQQSRRR
ncbi:uncharacterized protein L203_105634 [Cryptococcus depauperatus CBS 7841]|uniref:SWR1-complex protein 5 n=1 Tax=Cryptococcus depauperatus CBS 7841 TaxID=1295531 RepID=A0A1E3IF91_9TREE|nr:hypothetical protein L203_03511 [Cryptococcus depauperatus CBS 7841]